MKLRSIRVHGFKSFADTTEIQFHEGITTIVGPNGCGKSNISDAIRWVLGEQRPTAIRGAKMEEAIFQGSVNRRPVSRGSVSMVVSNEDGTLPVPFEEVEIGRRVYRDGGSDYSINRSVVRLKDVVDLVRDTGLGANAYNILENRMIEAILSDRAEERRALFEEAAGIGKYKDRRKAANRRLERAEGDLQRLEDVIAEVESKVRSLARQRGRAERYLKLRERRLSVEVEVVRHRLAGLEERLGQVTRELSGDQTLGEGMVAEVRAAEARYESLRVEQVEAEKVRAAAGEERESVRAELARWERDLAVAQERAGYAVRRLSRIEQERSESRVLLERFGTEAATLEDDARERERELERARLELAERSREAEIVQARLSDARATLDGIEKREQEVARRGAQLLGDAEASDAQAAELAQRLDRLALELETTSKSLGDLEEQGDLFSGRLETLEQDLDRARRRFEAAESAASDARLALDDARAAELDATREASALRAQQEALEAMERDQEGVQAVVAAAAELPIDGLRGRLLDYVDVDADLAAAVEALLGPLAQGLVVDDDGAARALTRWFEEEWEGGGGLIVLPLDRVPSSDGGGSLLERVSAVGDGAPWVRALLGEIDLVEHDVLGETSGRGARLAPTGASVDRLGVLRLGATTGASGSLERRAKIERLGQERVRAEKEADARARDRARLERSASEADGETASAREALRVAEDALRTARAELTEQSDRRLRLDHHRDDVARQVEGTRSARERARDRAVAARAEHDGLRDEEARLAEERERTREKLDEVRDDWEAARADESRIAVNVTRLEGELDRVRERLDVAREGHVETERRLRSIDEEETSLTSELEGARAVEAEGEEAMKRLFEAREVADARFRDAETDLEAAVARVREAEAAARDARRREREAADQRHRLELERKDVESRIERIRERVEGEWGKSLETLFDEAVPIDDHPGVEALEDELREIVVSLERIGPVNMLAVEEHSEESERLAFLKEQHGDLIEARSDLRAAIRQIDETATTLFLETFERIRESFRSVHSRLFEGGEADIWLEEDGDPLEAPIEIHASPHGKKTQRIHLLSGGERALTALSLLFAIYLVKPSPFCVLDEVDAPLDENNIGRFIRLLEEFKEQTQFIVITHNPRTIEAADWIYGVTMEEPGVSTIVGVQLEDALERARGTAA